MKVDKRKDPFYLCTGPEEVRARFKELVKSEHPDKGGTHEGFLNLIKARDAALEESDDILDMLGE